MLNPAQPRARHDLQRLLGIQPYDHQCQAVALGLANLTTHGSFGLLHDLGTGKTLSALGMFEILHERGAANTMLVVCPSSVIGSWQKECEGIGVECLALMGPVAKREAKLQSRLLQRDVKNLVVVTNYESVWRMEATLKAARFDFIACDESQRIKAPGSKQSRSMHRIGKTSRYRMLMSGTPIPEGSLGWYGQWRFADENLLGRSFANFKARYAVEVDMGTFRKVVGLRNLDELEGKILSRSHRVSKEDALDLPDEVDVIREFDLTPKARKVYDQLAKDSLATIEDEFGALGEVVAMNVLTRLLRLQQMTGGFIQLDGDESLTDIDPSKRKVLADVLEDVLDAGGKAVVFHRFTREGNEIAQLLDKKGIGAARIDGSVKSPDRRAEVDRFQEDPECKVFVAQIQAAGLGITLTAAATSIFYSMGYSGADYEQARARIHRIGQGSKVTHIHLVASKTVDEHIVKALRAKKSVSEEMTSGAWRRWLGGK